MALHHVSVVDDKLKKERYVKSGFVETKIKSFYSKADVSENEKSMVRAAAKQKELERKKEKEYDRELQREKERLAKEKSRSSASNSGAGNKSGVGNKSSVNNSGIRKPGNSSGIQTRR
jgi:hypothetical protein